MKIGYLSQYFKGVAAKRLKQGEVDPKTSNQHEFNGVNALGEILGYNSGEALRIPAQFLYLNDDYETDTSIYSYVTWYDSRRDVKTRAAEFRLYYPSSEVMECAKPGDLLIVAKRQDDSLMIFIISQGSTAENQVRLLFGLNGDGTRYEIRDENKVDQVELDFIGKRILEQIGIEIEEVDDDLLDQMLFLYDGEFPTTKVFSKFARESIPDVTAKDGADAALIAWMDREETLFRTFERHIVSQRLRHGFGENGEDVEAFIKFSLSVQNRRKSRVGHALENHIEAVFKEFQLNFSKNQITENSSKPDFIFPGHNEYHLDDFPISLLTMLGVKSSCKDRWRQVLAEANRIENKHLLTLETSISINQTDEMKSKSLSLVIPSPLHSSYTELQRPWLLSLKDFINLVNEKQSKWSKLLKI